MPPLRKLYDDSRRSALGEPLFQRYFFSAWQSTMGTWITRFVFGWIAWDLTESALWVGVTGACMLFPALVLAPLFGVLCDRINPRNGLLVALICHAVVAATAMVVSFAGLLSLAWLVLLALAIGGISAAYHPLRLALIPQLVPRALLPGAIGLSAIVFNLSRILGPALAGPLIAYTSSAVAFLLATLLFCGASLYLARIQVERQPRQGREEGILAQLFAGVRFAVHNHTMRVILLLTLVNGLLGRTVMELLPAISGQLLSGDAATLAILTSAAGAGSVLGGLLLVRQTDDEVRMARLALMNLAVGALILLPVHWLTDIRLLAPTVACLSLATTVAGISSQALAQLVVEEEFRGRVMSLWIMLSMGAPAVGALTLGGAADLLGFVPALASLGALILLVIVGLWTQIPLISRQRE